MKNTRIIGIISVTVLLLSTITIYGYESSGNKHINTYEATQESTPSVTTIPATTTPVTTNPTTKPVTKPTTKPVATTKPVSKPTTKPVAATKPTATKPKTTTAAKNNVKETTKIYNKVKSISLDKKAIRLNKGDKRTLTSYVKYKKRKKGVNEPLIWKTSNKKVATVSQKGVVKGKSNGKAYITLKSKVTGKTVKCKVTVAKTKYVAFTFDDGLKALNKNNAKATFFVVGSCVNSHKTQLKNEYKLHMEIGSHTYNHSNLKTLSVPQIKKELGSTNKVVKSVIGTTPTLLRPPYGSYNKTTGKYAGVPMIYWSVDTLDWKYRNVNYVSSTILKETKAWDIVLLHDIHQTSVDGFIKALPTLKKRGYELVTVSELYSLKGKKLKNGVMYFSPNRD